jgi:hypothetical protein
VTESVGQWRGTKQSHKNSHISYDIHLKLPFVAQRDKSGTLFEAYDGAEMIYHKVKDDANHLTNYACTALLIFEKEESAFLAENRASEFAYEVDCDY